MTVETIAYSEQLVVLTCGKCGVPFAMSDTLYRRCRADHSRSFYCPNGHPRIFTGPTEAERERARRIAAEATETHLRDQLRAAERSAAAYKGQATRIRNRIAAGVCPVPGCKRTGLTQTLRHINAKHPSWAAEHAHEIEVTP